MCLSYKTIDELFEAKSHKLIRHILASKSGCIKLIFPETTERDKLEKLKAHIQTNVPTIQIEVFAATDIYADVYIMMIYPPGAGEIKDFIEFRNSSDLISFITRRGRQ